MVHIHECSVGLENYVLQLLSKGDLQYCNYALILSMIAKIGSYLKDDTSDPCFESIWLKIKCYSIFQLHILFNSSKTIFCHCDNIGRLKSCAEME